MDYGKIIKRAFEITRKHPFLWVFGFIIALVSGGGNFNYSYQSGGQDQAFPKIGSFATTYLIATIIIAVLLFLIGLIVCIISLMAQGGLVSCVKKIEKGEETSLGDGFSVGAHYFWRILGLSVMLGLVIFLLALLVIAPIVGGIIFFATQSKSTAASVIAPAIFCLVLAIIFCVFVLIILGAILSIIFTYALRYIVLEDKRVFASIRAAWRLIRSKLKETVLMFLLLLAISVAVGVILAIPVLVIGLPALLAIISGVSLKNVFLIAGGVLGLIVLVLLLSFLRGIYTTFHSTAWTLTFLELTESREQRAGSREQTIVETL